MTFDNQWINIQSQLKRGDVIRNWTAASGFLGDDFTILAVTSSAVEVMPPNADTVQRVSKKDFEFMYNNWGAYCSGAMTRQQVCAKTRVSKYSMSILRHIFDKKA